MSIQSKTFVDAKILKTTQALTMLRISTASRPSSARLDWLLCGGCLISQVCLESLIGNAARQAAQAPTPEARDLYGDLHRRCLVLQELRAALPQSQCLTDKSVWSQVYYRLTHDQLRIAQDLPPPPLAALEQLKKEVSFRNPALSVDSATDILSSIGWIEAAFPRVTVPRIPAAFGQLPYFDNERFRALVERAFINEPLSMYASFFGDNMKALRALGETKAQVDAKKSQKLKEAALAGGSFYVTDATEHRPLGTYRAEIFERLLSQSDRRARRFS